MKKNFVTYAASQRRTPLLCHVDTRHASSAFKFTLKTGKSHSFWWLINSVSEKCPFCNVIIQETKKLQ